MRLAFALLGSALFTVGYVPAQNIAVFPSDHADQVNTAGMRSIAGASNANRVPFAYGVSRVQLTYDKWDVRIPNGRQINRVGFKAEAGRTSTGYQLQLEMSMAQPASPLSAVGTTFSSNVQGTTPTVVVNQGIFALPNLGGTGGATELFVPLDTPFAFDNTKNLVVEYKITANSNGNAAFNYYLDRATVLTEQRSYGTACPTSSSTTPSLRSTTTRINANWTLSLTGAPASANTVWLVGLASFEPGIPLNIIGLNGCEALVDPLVAVSGFMTNTGGGLSLSYPVPNQLGLVGAKLYSQVACEDIFAPGGPVVTSNGDEATLHTQPLATVVFNQGNATATTGSIARDYGLITYFDHN